jgi:phosphoribosylanthranilate isomerase
MVRSAPLIKICGITSIADMRVCARLEVEWIGLNFHPKSPRFVDERTASEIVRELPPAMSAVGVFVVGKRRNIWLNWEFGGWSRHFAWPVAPGG